MNCVRAEELFSDYREHALAPLLERELSAHLDECAACSELYRAFAELTEALGALSVPAPPDALPKKLAAIVPAKATHREPSRVTAVSPRLVAAASWLAVAAALLLVMVLRPPALASELTRTTSRTARDAYSFAIRTYNRTERWIEDLNVLRMTVGVAFEDRLDQINQQLKDLEDAGRRSDETDDEQSRRRFDSDPSPRSFS